MTMWYMQISNYSIDEESEDSGHAHPDQDEFRTAIADGTTRLDLSEWDDVFTLLTVGTYLDLALCVDARYYQEGAEFPRSESVQAKVGREAYHKIWRYFKERYVVVDSDGKEHHNLPEV